MKFALLARALHIVFVCAMAGLCVTAVPTSAMAQVLYGSLVGNVRDASGASVPGATVSITHKGTSDTREVATNTDGYFSFPTIQSGNYEIRVSHKGFQNVRQDNVQVSINSVARLDLTMQLGSVNETITVTGEAALLQTDRSEVRAEVSTAKLVNLPVPPGRNYQYLLQTIPGFRPPGNAHSVPTNPSRAMTFNVNGVSQAINNTRVDGSSSTMIQLPHIVAYVPTLEAVETVNVVTNSFDAEQGLAGGAAINLQIKSGTNDFHGSGFHYHTNQHLKARPYFHPATEKRLPKLVYNEFGGTFGGPIKREKLFFFGSYEGTLDRQNAQRLINIPTAAMKRGDLSASDRAIYDPLSGDATGANRTVFAGNQIPLDRIHPAVRKILPLLPDPNTGSGIQQNYFVSAPYLFDRHRADTKVNWNASEKFSTFVRYSILRYNMNNSTVFGDELGGQETSSQGGNPGIGTGKTHSLTAAGTYVISPTFIVDANFGLTRMHTQVEQPRLDENIGLDFLGIPGTNGPRRLEGGWPRFQFGGNFAELGITNNFMPYSRTDPQYQYVVNGNWTKGSHELRFGMDLYQQAMNHTQAEFYGGQYAGASGGFNFTGGVTGDRLALTNTNQYNAFASFLLGLPQQMGRALQVDDEFGTRASLYSLYVRDRWNVTRRLTLSYGVRWEYFPMPTRTDRGLEIYDVATNKQKVCGIGSVPKDCGIEQGKKMFAPRFGFAYRPTDTLVVRAGYGITNDPFSLTQRLRTNYPMLLVLNVDGANAFMPAGNLTTGIPAIQVPDFGNGLIDIPRNIASFTLESPFPRGYIQSWNLTTQKQLAGNFTAQVGYVGTRHVRPLATTNINAGQVLLGGNSGRPLNQLYGRTADTSLVQAVKPSRYDALQATVERRFANGFQLGAAYTFSKAIGYVENSDSGLPVNQWQYFDLNKRIMNYDRTHNLQITNIIETPFGPGKPFLSDNPLGRVLGGWQINNLVSMMSGTPFSVSANNDTVDMPGFTQRANQILPEVKILGNVGPGQAYFDPNAFAVPARGQIGNSHYNALRGPGVFNWDLGLFRTFRFNERFRLDFRAEAFNFTNTPHFANPGANVSNLQRRADGTISNLNGFSEIRGTSSLGRDGIDERQLRFGLRLAF